MWTHISDAAKQKAKQRWAIEKPKLYNARQMREAQAISALFAAPKISAWLAALRWQKEFRNKKKDKGLYPSRDL